MNLPWWVSLAIPTAAFLAAWVIERARRATARRNARQDRITLLYGERAAFRKIRRKYRRTAAEPPRQAARWWPW